MDDLSTGEDDELTRLEHRIDVLNVALMRCRKIALAARVMIATGAGWIVLVLLQLMPAMVETTLAALAALIGGIVLLGSNASTWTETEDELAEAQAEREQLRADDEWFAANSATPTLH